MKERRYHGQSRKRRLLAVMLVMAMLLGMSTISVYAGELTGDISMEQVDVDVGEAGTQKDTTESTDQEKTDKVQEEMEPSEDNQPETEQTEESQTEDVAASSLVMNLQQSTVRKVVPEHHKYIRYNGNDSYTLTLDVKGAYASESIRPKVDVLLIIDRSGSMDEEIIVVCRG